MARPTPSAGKFIAPIIDFRHSTMARKHLRACQLCSHFSPGRGGAFTQPWLPDGTCGKAFSSTRQDRDTNVVPVANLIHGRHHIIEELPALCADRWIIHRDDGDVIFDGDFDLTSRHDSSVP